MAAYKFRVPVEAVAIVRDVVILDVPDGEADNEEDARRLAEFMAVNLIQDNGLTTRWRRASVDLDTVRVHGEATPIRCCPRCGGSVHRCKTGDCLHCDDERCAHAWVPS